MSLIKNENNLKQIIDFTGISSGNMHPSDIDGVLEFDDKFLVLMEFKYDGINIPKGQKLLLERISKAWDCSSNDKKSVILRIKHNFNSNIIAKDTKVIEIFESGNWYKIKMNLKKCLMKLGNKWNCEKLKKF